MTAGGGSARWMQALLSVLFGPRRNPDRPRRFRSLATLAAPISPGSLPFAAVATVIETAVAMEYSSNPRYAFVFAVLRCGVPVVLSGYRPLLAWGVVALATPAGALVLRPVDPDMPWPFVPTALFSYWIVQYAVARAYPRFVSLLSYLVVIGFTALLVETTPQYAIGRPMAALVAALGFVWWLVGDVVRVQMSARQRLAEEERLTAEERARRQVLEERARIARELHDVVAHHMSVIAVQSSTAAYRVGGLTDDARREFDEIAESARASLAEMRRLLAVLRSDDDEALRVPQPGLGGIAPLVETTRRAGTPVTLDMERAPTDLPDGRALTVYRIVQEALSNVVRHSSGAETTVEVYAEGDHVAVRVTNGPPPEGTRPVEQGGAGHGLVGMRERVTVAGGTLVAEPRDDGGFVVLATLPSTERTAS